MGRIYNPLQTHLWITYSKFNSIQFWFNCRVIQRFIFYTWNAEITDLLHQRNYFKTLLLNIIQYMFVNHHISSTSNNIKWDHFEILTTGKSDIHCRIKETLLIRDLKRKCWQLETSNWVLSFSHPWTQRRLMIQKNWPDYIGCPTAISQIIIHCSHHLSSHWLKAYS